MLIWLQLVLVCVPGFYIALRLFPWSGPGRYAFCLGSGAILSLVITGALMWLLLETTGLILPWVPALVMLVLAATAALTGRLQPAWLRLPPASLEPASDPPPGWHQLLLIVLLGLMGVRVLSLLPDVLLRPLFAWDAWTVWAFEARLWFEKGQFVELLPPWEWLSAPADEMVRDNLVPYPRLIPGLILWALAGQSEWTGVGPGVLWLVLAVSIALVLYGVLRSQGFARVWAVLVAYVFLSLPFVNVHVSLYGNADLWLAGVLAVFAASLLLAEREGRRFWVVLAVILLLFLPLIKLEGLYWLISGLAALIVARVRISVRMWILLSLAGVGLIYVLLQLGMDLLAWLSAGRLMASTYDTSLGLASGLRHSLVWYDWHLVGYLLLAALVLLAIRPDWVERARALAVFCVFGLVILWGLTPLTGAAEFLAIGTLFSRIALQLMPALLLLLALVGQRAIERPALRKQEKPIPLLPVGGAVLAAGFLLLAGLGAWASSEWGSRQLLPPVVIEPEPLRWRLAEGQGRIVRDHFHVATPGPMGRVLLAVELPPGLGAERFDGVELHFEDSFPRDLRLGWSRHSSFRPGSPIPLERIADNVALARVGADADWRGELYWLAVDQVGFVHGPWKLKSIHLRPSSPGFWGFQRLWVSDALASTPWAQNSIHFLQPSGMNARFSPVVLAALWIVLSSLLLAPLLRRQRSRGRAMMVLLIIAAGWLALDVRWQWDLGQKMLATVDAFVGKPAEQRFASDLDGDLYVFLRALKSNHARGDFDRIFAFSETEFWRKRARYHLASWGLRTAHADELNAARVASLRDGDLLLLLDTPAIELRRIQHADEDAPNIVEVLSSRGEQLLMGEQILRRGEWAAILLRQPQGH